MRVGSLFSGIGGFDLGLPFPVSWQVELDKDCTRVLAHHFPEAKRYSDVREVGKNNLAAVDLICGGFPCQDLSVAGKRAGLGGERSGLWFEFHRIIRELGPSWVLIENVPGLLSSNGGRDFATIFSGLGDLGYFTAWRVLDSQWFGVAQRRRRVFIVASFGNGRCAEVLFEPSCGCGNPPARREAGEEVAGTIGGGSAESRRGYRADLDTQGAYVTETLRGGSPGGSTHGKPSGTDRGPFVLSLTERTRKEGRECEWQEDVAYCLDNPGEGGRSQTRLVALGFKSGQSAQDRSLGIEEELSPSLEGGGGGNNKPCVAFAQNTRDEVRLQGGDGQICGALTAEPGMKQTTYIATPMLVRRLTPTECLRLQGFPEDWLDLTPTLSDSAKYRMVGNAVTVPVIRWIGERIRCFK